MPCLSEPTVALNPPPPRDLGGLALLLGCIPFAERIFPARERQTAVPGLGLYPAQDYATDLAIRAGVRAGHW